MTVTTQRTRFDYLEPSLSVISTSAKNVEPSEEVADVVDVGSTERTPIVGLEVVALGDRLRFEFVHCDTATTVGTRYLRHERFIYGPNT